MFYKNSLRQETVLGMLGEKAILKVDPRHIGKYYGSKHQATGNLRRIYGRLRSARLKGLIREKIADRLESYIIRERNFNPGILIEEMPKYQLVSDFLKNIETPRESLWYQNFLHQINSLGIAKHKKHEMRSPDEILHFLDQYNHTVVQTMKSQGFCDSYTGFEATGIIDSQGCIGKTGSGNHRFMIARVLGIKDFPLKIAGIHESWIRKTSQGSDSSYQSILQALAATQQKYDAMSSSLTSHADKEAPPFGLDG